RVQGSFGEKWFYYLHLGAEWQDAVPFLVKAVRTLYQYNDKVHKSEHKLLKLLQQDYELAPASACEFIAFPSTVGMHVSLGGNPIGTQVSFKLDSLMSYENQSMGSVSPFQSSVYCAHFIALRVQLDQPDLKVVSSTHVSLAAFA